MTTSSSDPLLQLRVALGQRVTRVLETALAVEPPGGLPPPWRDLLAALEVEPMTEQQRYAAARRAALARGAPPEEVERCVAAIARAAREELGALGGVDPSIAATAGELIDSLARYTDHYLELARQRPAAAPGGMFGFALQTTKEKQAQAASAGGAASYVLRCPQCGGPRLRAEDLVCVFCDGKASV